MGIHNHTFSDSCQVGLPGAQLPRMWFSSRSAHTVSHSLDSLTGPAAAMCGLVSQAGFEAGRGAPPVRRNINFVPGPVDSSAANHNTSLLARPKALSDLCVAVVCCRRSCVLPPKPSNNAISE